MPGTCSVLVSNLLHDVGVFLDGHELPGHVHFFPDVPLSCVTPTSFLLGMKKCQGVEDHYSQEMAKVQQEVNDEKAKAIFAQTQFKGCKEQRKEALPEAAKPKPHTAVLHCETYLSNFCKKKEDSYCQKISVLTPEVDEWKNIAIAANTGLETCKKKN